MPLAEPVIGEKWLGPRNRVPYVVAAIHGMNAWMVASETDQKIVPYLTVANEWTLMEISDIRNAFGVTRNPDDTVVVSNAPNLMGTNLRRSSAVLLAAHLLIAANKDQSDLDAAIDAIRQQESEQE